MWKDKLYVNVDSANFWWGEYGLTSKVGWEDITIYDKVGDKYKKIASTCICAKEYLQSSLEELKDDLDEKDFVNKVKDFLSSNTIKYNYFYDNPNHEDFHEVSFEAKRNEKGIKPSYIEVWHPSQGIDRIVVNECIKMFLKEFLYIDVREISFKNAVSFEVALKKYVGEVERWNQVKGISFSDELIETLVDEWNISKEEVVKKLYRIIK